MFQFTTKKLNYTIDLSNSDVEGAKLYKQVFPLIKEILTNLKSDTFDCNDFPLKKSRTSGLTKKSGIYLLLNNKQKKVYLGSSSNLAQRKGEHYASLTKDDKMSKLSQSMIDAIKSSDINDFYFVPILIFESNQVIGFNTNDQITTTKQIADFLDHSVEQHILEELFVTNPNDLYNEKTLGVFQEGNTYGGSRDSGKQRKPVCYEFGDKYYAWESQSAACSTFNVDKNQIKDKISKGIMRHLTIDQFENFDGIKLTRLNANTYFEDKQDDLYQLTKKIFPKKRI